MVLLLKSGLRPAQHLRCFTATLEVAAAHAIIEDNEARFLLKKSAHRCIICERLFNIVVLAIII